MPTTGSNAVTFIKWIGFKKLYVAKNQLKNMQLDTIGLSIITVETAMLVLLMIYVYPRKLRDNTLNLIKHGFLSSFATTLNLVVVFLVMLPVFWKIISFDLIASSQFPVMWIHTILGGTTITLTLVLVVLWLKEPIGELNCSKAWKLMKPTLGMWALTTVLGAIIHIYGLR